MLLSTAHRFLATRVIDQAVRDVRNPNGAAIDNVSARAFLSGSPMLSYWCEIAELDPNCVIDRARILMAPAYLGSGHRGARFQRKASTPSLPSSVKKSQAIACPATAYASSSGSSS